VRVVCVVKRSPRFREVSHTNSHEALFLPYTSNYTPSTPLSLSFFTTMASISMSRDVDRDLEAQEVMLQPLGAAFTIFLATISKIRTC